MTLPPTRPGPAPGPLVRRQADGTMVIHTGSRPMPGEQRLADGLRMAGIAVIGVAGFGVVDAFQLTGATAALLEAGALLTFVAAAAVPLTRRWRQPFWRAPSSLPWPSAPQAPISS